MHYLAQYALFLAQCVTFVIAFLILFGGILSLAGKGKQKAKLKITPLNEQLANAARTLSEHAADKASKKHLKKQLKAEAKTLNERPRLFVIDFKGDMMASAVDSLREEVNAILTIATAADEVLVRLESPGGVVPGYGLAAAQLQRIKDKQIPLTVAVDKVAASGGYLMACVADKILASSFAVIGSIGVVSQLPNFHRLLQKNSIDFEMLTAGEYKRTLTVFGENDDKARDKAQHDIDAIHRIFKDHILQFRPQIDIAQVATGEYWLAHDALNLRLVDSLQTSDDYLLKQREQANLLRVQYIRKKSFGRKMHAAALQLLSDKQPPLAM